ncbi:hypothetical protein GGH96_003056 [Coemansia sp. RSA 1972]|nr:hypothetical protein GGH96_003056 [Coemansia sp. RSA 1972]
MAGYVAKTMLTDYSNNVMLRFGDTWRGAVNTLLKCKQRRTELVTQLEAEGAAPADIRRACEASIWGPARRLKETLGSGQPIPTSNKEWEIVQLLWPVLCSYSTSYRFAKQSLYYDVKVHPLQHLKAFVRLNTILAREKMQFVQALPLRRSWVYAHVPLNTAILVRCILNKPYTATPGGKKTIKPDIIKYWGRVVDLEQDMFQSRKHHQFLGFVMTDGVSISAVRETKEELTETSAKGTCDELQQPEQPAAQQAWLSYQPPLYQPQLPSVPSSYVWQSPQLPSVPSSSFMWQPPQPLVPSYVWQPPQLPPVPSSFLWQSPQLPLVPSSYAWQPLYPPQLPSVPSSFMWQSQQLPPVQQQQPPQQMQPVQRQRQQADCAYISELSKEQLQSTVGRCVLVDPGRRDLLFMLHKKSTVDDKNIYHYTRNQQRRETKHARYRKILQDENTADIAALERTLSAGSFTIPDLKLFEEYLTARAEVAVELTRHYNETMCRQRVGATTPEVPLHRKLRLSAYVNRQRADQLLMNRLRERFSQDAVFILGNWGAPMAKFHEPIRGKGWRTLLKRAGFDVYLIDEYLTSKTCPICEERISTFHNVKNPRPWMRTKRPMVKCHGLLGCQSQTCMEFFDTYGDKRGYLGKQEGEKEGKKKGRVNWRLWNRDLAAVLNFRKILFSLRETGTVPTCFQRKRKQPTDASKTTARKTTTRKATARKTKTFQAVNAV